MDNKKIENLINEYKEYAEKNGFQLNPNIAIVKALVKKLLENQEKYGYRYCPCRLITENIEKDKEKICPCKWHKDEIKKIGRCHCNLFVK